MWKLIFISFSISIFIFAFSYLQELIQKQLYVAPIYNSYEKALVHCADYHSELKRNQCRYYATEYFNGKK